MKTEFINTLHGRKVIFPAPEEAIDKANACNALSRDIYTDNTRFIYELLQNADDASCKSGSLTFRIDFVGNYLIVSHKGKPFNEDDIESICSIGDGSKAADTEQTGFKGIGFKSVFAYSDRVMIKSGEYCFKFDKEESNNYWDDKRWGNKQKWQDNRKTKNKTTKVSMPWQVIPINTSLPSNIPSTLLNGFTVSTIIETKKMSELKESVEKLFTSAQLILFLRSKNVDVTINTDKRLIIKKTTQGDITTISVNGEIMREWLMHTTKPLTVPDRIREQMEEDKDHYPEKLREATKASISFAINLKDGKIGKLESDSNIYSFLPTSVNDYDFPFIVNSNFITDAGRQNLHKDYVWNEWLFEEMPKHYLNWIVSLAQSNKYGLDFLKVLTKKSGSYDDLGKAYDRGMEKALGEIAFLPNNGKLLRVDEAVFDKTTISQNISSNIVISYINSRHNHSYSTSNILNTSYADYASKLSGLGVFVFDETKLKELFKSKEFFGITNKEQNAKLIKFLCNRYNLSEDRDETINWLQSTPFILAENDLLLCPTKLCFPSLSETNDEIDTIANGVYAALSDGEISWLREIGVQDISDTSLIDTGKLFEEGYVTTENAVEIVYHIIKLHCKDVLSNSHYSQLKYMMMLTTKGTLKHACNLYLSSVFQPDIDIEKHVDDDIFISEKYYSSQFSIAVYRSFFEKIGVSSTIKIKNMSIPISDYETNTHVFNDYIKLISDTSEQFYWESYQGWSEHGWGFSPDDIIIRTFPYLKLATDYEFARIIWENILLDYAPNDIDTQIYVKGYTGFISRTISSQQLKNKGVDLDYIKWAANEKAILPATDGKCYCASEIYANSIPMIHDLCGDLLPIINLSDIIDDNWVEALGIKKEMQITDYIDILKKIHANSLTCTDTITLERKKQITLIYQQLAKYLNYINQSQKEIIKDFANTTKLLAKDGKFYSPNELSIVLVDGFNNNKFAYIGNEKPTDELLQLMRLFGVNIIETIEPHYTGAKEENTEIKDRLSYICPLIACIEEGEYSKVKEKLLSNIRNLHFYNVDLIELTYGDNNDVIKKTVYAEDNNIFYVGTWNSLRVLSTIAEPIAKRLHIRNSAKMLPIFLTSDIDECIDYIEEFGFNVSDEIKYEFENSSALNTLNNGSASVGVSNNNGISTLQQIAENKEAKELVLSELSKKGFDTSKAQNNSDYSIVDGVMSGTQEYPLVVKSCKNYEGRLWINPAEWSQLFKPNSMLWVHFGGREVYPVRANDIFTYHDKLTLSFDSSNIMEDRKVAKIMEVMHYFNKVNLELTTLKPISSRADILEEYLFHDNNEQNSDLDNTVEL